jgi:hypothetical protein
MDIEAQWVINVLIGVIATIGGWLYKQHTTKLRDLECENEDLLERINLIAISLPEKYATKNDLSQVIQKLEHRFDRLDEKIDRLSNK